MSDITISGFDVQQDDEGRYSLNDLHAASGSDPRLKPANWLRLDQTKDLLAQLGLTHSDMSNKDSNYSQGVSPSDLTAHIPPVKTSAGRYGGTYACRELVYAYAMWMSPAFYLHVVRTFDAAVARSSLDRWVHLADIFDQVLSLHGRTTIIDAVITPTIRRRLLEALKNPDVQEFLRLHDGPVTDAFARQDKVCMVASLAFSQVAKFDGRKFSLLRKWADKARALTMAQVHAVEKEHVSPFRYPGHVNKALLLLE
jgi:hypothetical protein